jgi:replicative DNA helicase
MATPLENFNKLGGEGTQPAALEAERAVLGAVLLTPELVDDAAAILHPRQFYSDGHRAIFEALLSLTAERRPIDPVTLTEQLRSDGTLALLGEYPGSYVSELMNAVPRLDNVRQYAETVRAKARLRVMAKKAIALASRCMEPDADPVEILARADADFSAMSSVAAGGSTELLADVAFRSFERYEDRAAGRGLSGVPTGFRDIDDLLGGLQPSDLVILAARPSMGKSTLATQIAYNAAAAGQTSLLFGLEMSSEQTADRILAASAHVDFHKFRHGRLDRDGHGRLAEAYSRMDGCKMLLDGRADIGLPEIRSTARRVQREHGLDLIAVDYLQLMTSHGLYRPSERVAEIGYFSRGLKLIAKEFNVPVVALSQLSRACETRSDKRPLLSDLRESGNIEADADVVAFLYRAEVYEDTPENKGKAELIFRKHRNGPTATVPLWFMGEFVRFENAWREGY